MRLPRAFRIVVPLCCMLSVSGAGWSAPGQDLEEMGATPVSFGSLLPVITESGHITLSIDGAGSLSGSGVVQVDKPSASATVRGAYLAAASVGFQGFIIPDGFITLEGESVNWQFTTPSSISSSNHWADVTSIVKPVVDAAGAGLVDLVVTEDVASQVDGEILAVIFDDPSQSDVSTAVLFFGAQEIAGDEFYIALASPLDTSDPDLLLDFSLGISFGFQNGGSQQYSIVEVNNSLVTSSAGGEDDGGSSNGALLTVGGIGDTNDNPDPSATPTDPRSDDELYNMIPFVSTGDTEITVFSRNPSADDNILFAALNLSDQAIVGEGILLAPLEETNRVNDSHTVTALIQDDAGNPIVGTEVVFTITGGPNVGATSAVTSGNDGRASFTYSSFQDGTDFIVATFENSSGNTVMSNPVQSNWRVPLDVTQRFCTEDATFVPDTSSYSIGAPTCGGVATFSFDAELTNISSQDISSLDVIVGELSSGYLVCNADTNGNVDVPTNAGYSDGVLSTLESVTVPFEIGITDFNAFNFFVDVVGAGCNGELFSIEADL